MKRPTGVTVLAILLLLVAAFRFIVSFIDFGVGSTLTSMSVSPGYIPPALTPLAASLGNLGFWIGLVGMIVAFVMFIAARGLWGLYPWGWWTAVVCLIVGLTLNLMPILQGTVTPRLATLTVVDACFLAYLLTPQVRAFFVGFPTGPSPQAH